MNANERMQGMLCERIESLETSIGAWSNKIDMLHTTINLMQNRRTDKKECAESADYAREKVTDIVKEMRAAVGERA